MLQRKVIICNISRRYCSHMTTLKSLVKTELHVLNTVGESIQAEAQEQIKKEKQKTGVQVKIFMLHMVCSF